MQKLNYIRQLKKKNQFYIKLIQIKEKKKEKEEKQ